MNALTYLKNIRTHRLEESFRPCQGYSLLNGDIPHGNAELFFPTDAFDQSHVTENKSEASPL